MQITLNDSSTRSKTARPEKGRNTPAKNAKGVSRRKTASTGTFLFGALISAALIWGWFNRGAFFHAESGAGYYMGIAGALSMLALLAYPLRKYVRWMNGAGPVSFWFRLHMALGLIGPTLILFHANFGLGSTNSNVALWSMLIVAGSGLIGRFFYSKIHRGLYGKRAEARDLMAEARTLREELAVDIGEKLAAKIDKLEEKAFAGASGMFSAASSAFTNVARARALNVELRRSMRKAMQANPERRNELRKHLMLCNRYFNRVEQAAELGFYERLFAAWHILHLPLFFLLIITAIIHVVAVHLY